jgi:hypothetical protein
MYITYFTSSVARLPEAKRKALSTSSELFRTEHVRKTLQSQRQPIQ